MNELTCYNLKCPKKTRKLPKIDKFVYFVTIFINFMKLRINFQLITFISHVILSENLLNDTAQKF